VEPLSAAILAGGKNRRMGRDKAMMRIAGTTLLELVACSLSPIADEVFVVASDGAAYAALGFYVVPDAIPDAGSLGGIYSAVAHATHDYCLVVACDMPLLNPTLLSMMARMPRDYDALVPALSGDRSDQGGCVTLETLHAIYRRTTRDPFLRRIEQGQLKIAEALEGVKLVTLSEEQLRAVDPELLSFFNVNTPDDLEFATAMLDRMTRARDSG
jgi:molybdopterin-guanine dinucleotide biosynthesis protein A